MSADKERRAEQGRREKSAAKKEALADKEAEDLKKIRERQLKEAARITVVLLSPFTPHICEELWHLMGNKTSVFKEKWPGCSNV